MFAKALPGYLTVIGFVLAAGLLVSPAGAVDSWPQFRGPGALGTTDSSDLPETWDLKTGENIAWQATIPGRGWSSPVVWGDRVFLTTVEREGGEKIDARRGIYLGGDQKAPPGETHRWLVVCLNLSDGTQLWQRTVHEGVPPEPLHAKNTYASATPVTDGKRVYAYFGNVGVYCFDFDGEPVWSRPIEPHKVANGWGTGASPTLHAGRLYIQNDNEEQSYLLALDAATGNELWRTPREERTSWATPLVWENSARIEIVAAGSGVTRSYDMAGKPLWELTGMSDSAVCSPFAEADTLYISSGNGIGRRQPIAAVIPGGDGNITPEDEGSNQHVLWYRNRIAPFNPSTLLYKGLIYALRDGGIIACYEAKTGETIYEKKRLPEGRAFTASPWAYGDRIFCLSEYGKTFVLKAGREFEVLAVNPLGEDEMYLATPAIAGDKLLVRGDGKLYAIEKGAKTAAK